MGSSLCKKLFDQIIWALRGASFVLLWDAKVVNAAKPGTDATTVQLGSVVTAENVAALGFVVELEPAANLVTAARFVTATSLESAVRPVIAERFAILEPAVRLPTVGLAVRPVTAER